VNNCIACQHQLLKHLNHHCVYYFCPNCNFKQSILETKETGISRSKRRKEKFFAKKSALFFDIN
jgi:hypothetical protein